MRGVSSIGCTVKIVRLDIGQYRVRQQITRRAASCQQVANLRGGNRQRSLPDETDLPARPFQAQRVADTARGEQVAQRLRRFAVGIRPLQYQQMAVLEQLLPAMPARQTAKGIPAEQQEQLVTRGQLGT